MITASKITIPPSSFLSRVKVDIFILCSNEYNPSTTSVCNHKTFSSAAAPSSFYSRHRRPASLRVCGPANTAEWRRRAARHRPVTASIPARGYRRLGRASGFLPPRAQRRTAPTAHPSVSLSVPHTAGSGSGASALLGLGIGAANQPGRPPRRRHSPLPSLSTH